MKLYSIQVAHKGTNGRICILEQEFEGDTSEAALEMAKLFYSDKIRYRNISEMIFSTPIETVQNNKVYRDGVSIATGRGSVSIGGSLNDATIVTSDNNITGQGNVVIQRG
jgi:hypothetical protein